MYIFKTGISKEEHDAYITAREDCNLLQSSKWALVKSNWDNSIVGVYNNEKLVFSVLVLIKRLPLKFTMMYIPKGPIMDFDNKELVSFFFSELKKWAKKQNCLYITFDPTVAYRRFTTDNKDKEDDPFAYEVINKLKDLGCTYKGRTMNISETIQPRFHMYVPYTDNIEEYVPHETIKSYNTAKKRHVYGGFYSKENLKEFFQMIELTEKKKGVNLRSLDYFEKIMNTYGEDSALCLAKVNPKQLLDELNEETLEAKEQLKNYDKLTHKAQNKYERIVELNTKEIEKLTVLCEKYPDETVVAGGLMVGYGNTIEMLYAGRNDDFRAFRPQYLLYIEKFKYAFTHGYKYANMGGVEGSLDDGLSTFKSNFNPNVVEYIGEFDLPVLTPLYKLAKIAQKIKMGK